jgi:hypothetical protein
LCIGQKNGYLKLKFLKNNKNEQPQKLFVFLYKKSNKNNLKQHAWALSIKAIPALTAICGQLLRRKARRISVRSGLFD